MAGSSRKINYSLRPAKSIERKMLTDAFRRLADFFEISSYRYIGFGAVYFSDFSLFHRALGIRQMISIEATEAPNIQRRFQFNVPYSFIKLEFGKSWEVLPRLHWDSLPTILWLDYDGELAEMALNDVETFFAKASPGSVIAVSYNIQDNPADGGKPIDRLKKTVGEANVPQDITDAELVGWSRAEILRRIVNNKIAETLSKRNAPRSEGSKLQYRQLFNFQYKDGAMMATVGGIIYVSGQEGVLGKCAFESLQFCRSDEKFYRIEVPLLTFKEIRHLDSLMPIDPAQYEKIDIPPSEIKHYCDVYRYFPAFVESEL